MNYATATSILTNQPTGYYSVSAAVVNLSYVGVRSTTTNTTSAELIAGLSNGQIVRIPETLNTTTSTRLLNWRELPSVQ